ncbi:hypothetical protein QE109_11980 [Fusibacter bizertensis]|uniref:SIR2-like domain-containing protein n=1 Tax=Fusibacter bizertensis TaxID=1488331 RepID=A0ABT6NEL7_9FIRM|nr:hypothetical protein [Fusibacter bizertensis]MDH8678874.1 hypothetical protein [Fusibacter bizertensis]
MNKAILIGNGFTSYMNSNYYNAPMMTKFFGKETELVGKIESLFDKIRNLDLNNTELLDVSEALFPSEGLYPSDTLIPSSDSIAISNKLKDHVVSKLSQIGFENPNEIFESYFAEYGLWSSVNCEKLNGIETYLKVLALFGEINKFSKEEYIHVKKVATDIYFNNANHGIKSINNEEICQDKLVETIKDFKYIFTTNYDTIVDDILDGEDRFPYHLHGGFSINHRNKDPDGRYTPSEARLIWGINAEEKYDDLKAGFRWDDFNYGAFRYGQSRLADYYDILQEYKIDEIHILGYSGENDDHINKRIIENQFIKKVVVYVNPCKIKDRETKVRNRLLFGRGKKLVELRPWSEFWNKVVNEIDKD